MWERGRISTRGGQRPAVNETVPGCGKERASQRGVAGARVWKRASSSTRGQLREQLKLRKSLREGDKSTSLHDFTTGRPAPCTHYAHLQCRRRMCMKEINAQRLAQRKTERQKARQQRRKRKEEKLRERQIERERRRDAAKNLLGLVRWKWVNPVNIGPT